MSFIAPAAGLVAWEWFSIFSPHLMVFGFARGQPFNELIAIATLGGWLLSRERKSFPTDALPWMMLLFCIWVTFNGLFVPIPDVAWHYWGLIMKIFVGTFLAFMLLTTKARIHAMIWTLVISVGYYGMRGGIYTLATLGNGHVIGPMGTMLGDNNSIALIEVMTIPLLYYLAKHTQHLLVRLGLIAGFILQILSVFGSYSRGGIIALCVVLLMFWLRVKNKITYAIAGIAVLGFATSIMPAAFWERMDTLHNVSADSSFEGRVQAWHVAYWYANAHFPFGAGFYSLQVPQLWHQFYPDSVQHAAHSIYFQVLGEHGYPGLAIYLVILFLALRNARFVMRRTRDNPELEWLNDLARMITAGLISYYVGGAALSLAYFDGFLMLIALTSTMREMAIRCTTPAANRTTTVQHIRARPTVPVTARTRQPLPQVLPNLRRGTAPFGESDL